MNITNLVAKVLTILLVSSLAWGCVVALLAFWIFGTSLNVAWITGLSIFGGMLFCISVMAVEFFRSINPDELKDDEGNEFLEAVMLGYEKF